MEGNSRRSGKSQEKQQVTGKAELGIAPFLYYSSCMTLEEAAAMALLPAPQKTGLWDAEIRELETGLDNITDYIYNPDEVGMDLHASVEDIINKILADRK